MSATGGESTKRWLLRAKRILTPIEEIAFGAVSVVDGKIQAIGPASAVGIPSGAQVVDCGDVTIAPGFVDVHIHGSGGDTAMDGASAIARISRFIARFGVTSWLPTLTPCPRIGEMVEVIRAGLSRSPGGAPGAEVAGLHLEGPFLSARRPGAIRAECFRMPAIADVDKLLSAAAGQVRLMTLAPELPGGLDLVRHLVARGVVASIGHSDATHDQALAAIEAGVSHATHTFNAMRGFLHREPGVAGVVLASDRLRAELIADGVHVHPLAMQLLIQAKDVHRVALITDAVAPAGRGDGDYEFDGRPITVRSGRAALADGTIAGSVATFDANLRRIVTECGVPLRSALIMASMTPSRSVGLAHRKGYLAGGHDADLVAIDADLRVRLTMARGEIVYDSR